jgi:hypothetical protein
MYDKGKGVLHDNVEAVKWYRLAAEQGDVSAQLNLGLMYAKGKGVPQNIVFAHMWWNLAGAQGNESAKKNADLAAREMTPDQLAESSAWRGSGSRRSRRRRNHEHRLRRGGNKPRP